MVSTIELNKRQEQILQIVKENGPITGEHIAEQLNLTRATAAAGLGHTHHVRLLRGPSAGRLFLYGKTGNQSLADKLKKLQVKDFQSIPVVINENVSVYDAICTMFLEDVGTLFVVDRDAVLVGVLSRKDLLRASIGQQELASIPVHIIMTRMPNIAVCRRDDYVMDIAKYLIENRSMPCPLLKIRIKALRSSAGLPKRI